MRLTGIDLPDYRPGEPGDFSLAALSVLRDMLEGQSVTLYQTREKDRGRMNRMGHMLAHIVRDEDGAWVQGTLLTLGLARVQTLSYNPEMAAQMLALEKAARTDKIGIWGDSRFAVLTPETATEHIGSFQIVEGNIYAAALNKNRLFLNFGQNWRDDFTVMLSTEAKRQLEKQGLDPMNWGGRKIRVRGWLESYNGPFIEADHAQVIELLNEPPSAPAE